MRLRPVVEDLRLVRGKVLEEVQQDGRGGEVHGDSQETDMTRYVEAFSWTGTIQRFLDEVVEESPLLNVCSGRTKWGDVGLDLYEPTDVRGGWKDLPFARA